MAIHHILIALVTAALVFLLNHMAHLRGRIYQKTRLCEAAEEKYRVLIETDLKQAEEKLRLYRELYLNSKDGIVILDPEGRYIDSNPEHHNRREI